MTEKKGILLSVVISASSTHDLKQVTEVVDNVVIKIPKSLSRPKPRSRRRRRLLQHLCLDEGYKSKEEEQQLIRRGYVLHIPIKKKKKKKRGGEPDSEEIEIAIPNCKNILLKDGLLSVLIHGITGSGNFSQDMKRRMKTILGWYSSPVVS